MNQDNRKASEDGNDDTRLYGPANDERLTDRMEGLTGSALETAIQRIDTLEKSHGSGDEGDNPFPFGLEADGPADTSPSSEKGAGKTSGDGDAEASSRPVETSPADGSGDAGTAPGKPAPEDATDDDVRAAENLDDILLDASGEDEDAAGPDDRAPENGAVSAAENSQDNDGADAATDGGDEQTEYPQSPISAVLARPGSSRDTDVRGSEYFDPGLPVEKVDEDEAEESPYDPMDFLDDMTDMGPEDVPDDDWPDTAAEESTGSDQSPGSGLPEPSPMQDPTGMGDFPFSEHDTGHADDVAPEDSEEDQMAHQGNDDDPDLTGAYSPEKAPRSDAESFGNRLPELPEDGDVDRDSAPAAGGRTHVPNASRNEVTSPSDEDDGSPEGRGGDDALDDIIGFGGKAPDSRETPEEALSGRDDEETRDDMAGEEPEDVDDRGDAARGKGRGRLMAGLAATALIAIIGAGGYFYMADSPSVAPASDPGLAGPAGGDDGEDVAGGDPLEDPAPGEGASAAGDTPVIDSADVADGTGQDDPVPGDDDGTAEMSELSALLSESADEPAGTGDQGPASISPPSGDTDAPVEDDAPADIAESDAPNLQDPFASRGDTPQPNMDPSAGPDDVAGVDDSLSDLRRELDGGRDASADDGLAGRVDELVTTISGVAGDVADAAEERAAISSEMTDFSGQISALMERDAQMRDRMDRLEGLVRGQNAMLSEIGRIEEELEQTQIVLLDVSSRIGEVEARNPADRDAVNSALSDMEDRLDTLTANMSILARMSIEGVDSLRANGASAGNSGVRTSDTPAPRAGNDTVYRGNDEGFRITSDPRGNIPDNVEKDDFVEGYGYVLDVLPTEDGQRLVVMENGAVLVPGND